ncbi:CopG family ribbon-helix-helix protein [Microbacterium sp. B2969]|uniref:CopG family ribbon-helix-helix protein n=1 Tax=Microbacterium alkaliflavum TaxID=3248839 RepID=A0ABW7Q5S5_9MICO
MKTAISIPDSEFERFERVAARHGMNRSEFFRRAGRRFVEELEGEAELTALADAVIQRVGQPSAGSPFLGESERNILESTEW